MGDRVLWLDKGCVRELGPTEQVVVKYLAMMQEKDSTYLEQSAPAKPQVMVAATAQMDAPEIVTTIPNMDHRHGDARARVIGIAVMNAHGEPIVILEPDSRIIVRVSVRAAEYIGLPNVGFMLRNHLGLDFAGSNTTREGHQLAPMSPEEIRTVDFHIDLPSFYPGHFSFSPAIADGTLENYRMCDWIDNAITLQMGHSEGSVYGYLHLPCRVEVNARLMETVHGN